MQGISNVKSAAIVRGRSVSSGRMCSLRGQALIARPDSGAVRGPHARRSGAEKVHREELGTVRSSAFRRAGPVRSAQTRTPSEWDFDTLTLVALYYHPSLDVARAQWAVAQAGIRTAGQRPNPAANLSPQYTSNSPSGESPWVAALTIEPIIETAGKRGYRIEQAKQVSESARLSLAAQAWQVRSGLRTSLLDYAIARQRVVLLQNVRDAQQQILKLLEGRLKAGDIAATDLTTPRVALIRTQADLADAQRQVVDSRAAVAQALGVPLQALAGREIKFEIRNPNKPKIPMTQTLSPAGACFEFGSGIRTVSNFPDDTGQQASAFGGVVEIRLRIAPQALHSRADILAALADYAASQSALQLEIAKQYPDIRLGPGYEYDQGLHKWGLAVGTDVLARVQSQPGADRRGPGQACRGRRSFPRAPGPDHRRDRPGAGGRHRLAGAVAADRRPARDAAPARPIRRSDGQGRRRRSVRPAYGPARSGHDRVDPSRRVVKVQQALGQLEDAVQTPLDALPRSSEPAG